MINSVTISGNLTRDIELRSTQGGTPIATFTVAVNDRRKNPQSGEWEDYANFVGCVLFGKRAESLSRILSKGMKVAVHGKLHYSSWDKDGQKRSKLEVVADEVELMSKRNDSMGQQDGSYGQQYQQQGNYANQQQYAPQNGYQQPVQGYQQQDLYSNDCPF